MYSELSKKERDGRMGGEKPAWRKLQWSNVSDGQKQSILVPEAEGKEASGPRCLEEAEGGAGGLVLANVRGCGARRRSMFLISSRICT